MNNINIKLLLHRVFMFRM